MNPSVSSVFLFPVALVARDFRRRTKYTQLDVWPARQPNMVEKQSVLFGTNTPNQLAMAQCKVREILCEVTSLLLECEISNSCCLYMSVKR